MITLTPGAAAAISGVGDGRQRSSRIRMWSRWTELRTVAQPARPLDRTDGSLLIGVHAKSLRANVDPLPVLIALDARAVRNLPAIRVRVDLHPDLLTRTDAAGRRAARVVAGQG